MAVIDPTRPTDRLDADASAIHSWHAHIYFDGPAQRATAAELREQIAQRFEVQLGRWRDQLVGPHTRPMYMVAFAPATFAGFVPWLSLSRRGLDVLLHPNTLAPLADHLDHALWLGQQLTSNDAVLPLSVAAGEDEPLLINNRPGAADVTADG